MSQIIAKSRNLAINGSIVDGKNRNIGLYFNAKEGKNTNLQIFSYPFDISRSDIEANSNDVTQLIEKFEFEQGIQLDSIWWEQNMLFYFHAITWELYYYSWKDNILQKYEDEQWKNILDVVDISYSYEKSKKQKLQKTIEYITQSNIINY